MVPLLVLVSFVTLVVVGVLVTAWLAHRSTVLTSLEAGEVERIEGFEVRRGLAYHPHHLWVGGVGRDRVRVGLDDFVRRIVGPPEHLSLPGAGREVSEGTPVIELVRAGKTVRLPAPVAGTVVRVNPDVLAHPELAAKDPMGRGWLFEVRLAGSRATKALLRGRRVHDAMEAAVNRMRAVLTGGAGLAMTDGGVPVEDYKQVLDDDAWAWLLEWALPGDADQDRRL